MEMPQSILHIGKRLQVRYIDAASARYKLWTWSLAVILGSAPARSRKLNLPATRPKSSAHTNLFTVFHDFSNF